MKQSLFQRLTKQALGLLYNGAQSGRARAIPAGAVANDTRKDVTEFDRIKLDRLARYLYANIGAVKGGVNSLARSSTPLTPIPKTSDAKWNLEAKNWFNEWSKICDVTGRFTLAQMQFMESVALDVSGEIFVLLTQARKKSDEAAAYPLLQMIRPHRIGSAGTHDPYLFDGVWINELCRPQYYRVLKGWDTPSTEYVDVPARDIIHIGEASASDQIRHVSNLAHAINNLRDIEDIAGFEKMAVKINAAIATVIKSPRADVDGGIGSVGGDSSADAGGEKPELTLEKLIGGGAIPRLAAGEELQAHQSNRPASNFTSYLDYLLRDVSCGMEWPLEFFWDPSALGGPTQRTVLARAQRRAQARQRILIAAQQRKWNFAISRAILRGELPENPEFWKVDWQGPPAITIDNGRDAQQNREDMKFGLRTHAEDAGERGINWQDERFQAELEADDIFERARRLADKHGVPLDTALNMLQQRNPNPQIALMPTHSPPSPVDTSPGA